MKRSILVAAVAALLVLGGVAYAAIPDAQGVIHGCYKLANPNRGQVLAIDTDAGQACPNGYAPLNWHQVLRTTTVTSTSGSGQVYQPGDGPLTAATCPSGWKVISGGWEWATTDWHVFRVVWDKPSFTVPEYPSAWSVRFQNATDQPQSMSVEVYAICTPVAA